MLVFIAIIRDTAPSKIFKYFPTWCTFDLIRKLNLLAKLRDEIYIAFFDKLFPKTLGNRVSKKNETYK